MFFCYFLLFEGRCLLQLGGAVRRAPGKAGTVTREGPGCCPRPGTPPSALSRAGGTLRQRLRTQIPVLPQARTGPCRIGYFCLRNQMVVFFCQGRKIPDTEACGPVHVRTRRAPGAPGGATALAGRGSAPCATVRLSTSLNLSVPRAPPPPASLGPQNRSFLSSFHLKSYNRIPSIFFYWALSSLTFAVAEMKCFHGAQS